MRVYFRDQNPAVDHFAFKCSVARGKEKVSSGEGEYILDGDGRTAIQLYRSQASRDNSWMAQLEEITAAVAGTSSSPFAPVKYIPSPTCGCAGATHRVCGRTIEREEKPIPPTPQEIAAFMQSRELVSA